MPLTPLNTPPQSKKILLHSPFLHTRLPQMLPRVQYARRSKIPLPKSGLQGSSESAKTGPPMSPESTSHTPMGLLPASSTTQTRKIYHPPCQRFCILVPPFKHHYHLAEPDTPSHSPTTSPPTKPSSPPSPGFVTTLTVATCTSNRLKRLFELDALSDTKGCPVKMMMWQLLLRNSVRSDDWNLSQIPLHHRLPLTTPFQHLPYQATRKSRPIPRPPIPESALWPADRLRPSNALPKVNRVQGLKLTIWEQECRCSVDHSQRN